MSVITRFEPPPIPVRHFDWNAHLEGDSEGPNGYGGTELEAVMVLAEKLRELIEQMNESTK